MLWLAPDPGVVRRGAKVAAVQQWPEWQGTDDGCPDLLRARTALHSCWWNTAHSQENPEWLQRCSRRPAVLQQPGQCWKCSEQGWCSCRSVWVIPLGSFPFWAREGLSILHCSACILRHLSWWTLLPITHIAKEPLGISTWYFSLVRYLFDQNWALSGNSLPQLVLGIDRFVWRNQIKFLSSTKLSIKVQEGKWYNFSLFFPNTLRLKKIKYTLTLHPHEMLCRDTWPKSGEWQISESAGKFDY